jgi:transposase
MTLQLIGIDLAKNVFHLHGVDGTGREVFRKRVYRDELLASLRAVNPCKVVMESCGGSNYWARAIESLGHQTQLIAPQYVKPFVRCDATAELVRVRRKSSLVVQGFIYRNPIGRARGELSRFHCSFR